MPMRLKYNSSYRLVLDIADTLRERRLELGLSQEQVADRMGSRQSHLSELERGYKNFGIQTLVLWAQALGMELVVDFEEVAECDEPWPQP